MCARKNQRGGDVLAKNRVDFEESDEPNFWLQIEVNQHLQQPACQDPAPISHSGHRAQQADNQEFYTSSRPSTSARFNFYMSPCGDPADDLLDLLCLHLSFVSRGR